MSKRSRHGKQTHEKNLERSRDSTEVGRARNARIAKKEQEAVDTRAAKLQIGNLDKRGVRKTLTSMDKAIRRKKAYILKTDQHIHDAQDRKDAKAKANVKSGKKVGLFDKVSKGISRAFSKKAR